MTEQGRPRLRRAAILAIGSELLTPQRTDTNSLHITDHLNRLGIDVVLKLIVGDDREELAEAFRAARRRAERNRRRGCWNGCGRAREPHIETEPDGLAFGTRRRVRNVIELNPIARMQR